MHLRQIRRLRIRRMSRRTTSQRLIQRLNVRLQRLNVRLQRIDVRLQRIENRLNVRHPITIVFTDYRKVRSTEEIEKVNWGRDGF